MDLHKRLLYIFAGADGWRCVLADGKRGIRRIGFTVGPEEHLRSFLRGSRVKRAHIILSTEKSILRFSELPLLKTNEIKKASSFLYEDNFPIDKSQYTFGYKVLNKDSEKYSLLLAALPSETVSGFITLFKNLGITVERLELFEGIGGLSLSAFNSILVFIKQEISWRIIWMKGKTPMDTWRVGEAGDIHSLFAELDDGGTIDNALFYSTPESWVVSACEEYGLTVSEAMDADCIFFECGASVNMLPETYARKTVRGRLAGICAILLLSASAALFTGAVILKSKNETLRERRTELSAQIHTLNEEAGSQPDDPPLEFTAHTNLYGSVLTILTGRLPAGAYIQRASSADGVCTLVIRANGSGWLNRYIGDCQSVLDCSILTSKISSGEGVTEIELLIEMR